MKKIIGNLIIAASLSATTALYAQQLPVMNHYIYNPSLYNPARTGQKDFGTVAMHFKKQWVNMPNSPFTGILSAESPIKTPKLGNMGLGGMLYVDQMHIVTKVGGLASYAYHIPFGNGKKYKHGLSAGLSLGFINQRFNFPDAIVGDESDNQLLGAEGNGTAFDFSAGLDYQWRDLHIGASMLQGLNTSLQFFNVGTKKVNYINTRHLLLNASYKHTFGGGKKHPLYIEPSFMGRIIENVPFQAEGNISVGLDGMGWLGVGYRSSNNATATSGLIGTIGVEVKKQFVFIYSIGFAIEDNLLSNFGTQHEFMLAYRFGDNKKIKEMQLKMDSLELQNMEMQKQLAENQKKIGERVEDIENKVGTNATDIQKNSKTIENNKAGIDQNKSGIDQNKKELEALRKLIEDQPLRYKKVGEVFFDNGSTTLGTESNANLDAVVQAIKQMKAKDKEIKIYVKGNASTNGDAKTNMALSMKRAAAVRQYLISKGLAGENVMIIPMGESDPTDGSESATSGDSKDRRVDIIFTEKKLQGKL